MGGAEVWRIAGSGYLIGTPKEVYPKRSSEWFYMDDVPLPDPVRRGLPEFSSAPLKKRLNWHPRSPKEEDSADIKRLVSKVRLLAHTELSIVEVMAIAIKRCVQPLQSRVTPLWCYNGEDDASHYRRKGPDTPAELATILADLYKGEKEDFLRLNCREGHSMYNPIEWVRLRLSVLPYCCHDMLIQFVLC